MTFNKEIKKNKKNKKNNKKKKKEKKRKKKRIEETGQEQHDGTEIREQSRAQVKQWRQSHSFVFLCNLPIQCLLLHNSRKMLKEKEGIWRFTRRHLQVW